ncbi:glycosyltransferase family 69 protein [Gonapodya prolifera JEL478]|uniref:Glycosyltransferase family 69 protein n=1 Tax=Gonapodya prolifera (strain JEL478) TaxID=1344416 RepID=A0A139AYK3_GONPJ|nr:glycosyltransferase family 69 protein [Gonapodya prolifera JEL478]|eukprot:KXS21828.1 glycosyltransferase family 69 protein [Gonapodya prolifera JEL478]
MFYRRPRRLPLPLLLTALCFICLDAAFQIVTRPVTRHRVRPTFPELQGNFSVYVAAALRNAETIQRDAWNDAVIGLADYLGPHRLHVSIVEGGSEDGTKESLQYLAKQLEKRRVGHSLYFGESSMEYLASVNDRPERGRRPPGWIWNERMRRFEKRRIPHLADVRNKAMEPLQMMAMEGKRFDRVLWLNDVAFDVEDFVTLLNTRSGRYAAACAIDFEDVPSYYDSFATRDDLGFETASTYWPWFLSPTSRAAAISLEPVPVTSCWSGMVAFDAAPFYGPAPLSFRGVEDTLADFHLEASECCLVHTDNPLSRKRGVWLNPNVRVGYSLPVYKEVRRKRFPSAWHSVVGAWSNRLWRWYSALLHRVERWAVSRLVRKWAAQRPSGERIESGVDCIINDVQVLWDGAWRHI